MQMAKIKPVWGALAGLVMVGIGFYLSAPALAVAALPYLLWAACPLAMLVMMKGMQGSQNTPASEGEDLGPTREERLHRLRERQEEEEELAQQIDGLEHEPSAPLDGRH